MRLLLHRFPAVGGLLLFALICAAMAHAATANAATLIVTNTNDSGPGSLRQALADANNGDTIQFAAALNGQTIMLTSGELAINNNITINGPGPGLLTVSRGQMTPDFRICHVMPGHAVMIKGLTIQGGFDSNGGGGARNDHATLTIDNCVIKGNASTQDQTGKGGGIYNDGSGGSASLTILNSTVMNNNTGATGGGIYNSTGATLNLTNSNVAGNQAVSINPFIGAVGSGGGIANDGTLTVINSAISNNSAGLTSGMPGGSGGGISSNGALTITSSTINGNVVGVSGGGLFVGGTVTITNTIIMGNRAYGDADGTLIGAGGGIVTVTAATVVIANSTLTGNTAALEAGAIGNEGMLTIIDTTIAGNSAENGGGIVNYGGTVELRSSTVYGNSAIGQPTSLGGGIYNTYHGAAVVRNSTITGNYAARYGAAISNDGTDTTLTVANSTINGNRADGNGGIYNSAGHVELENTILKTGSSGANIFSPDGTVTSHGYNLSNDDGAGFLTAVGDQINTDPMLGPLQNNGGPTFTHALLPGSPAINTGDPNFTPPPATDQRGYPRVYGGRIDIGSFELQVIPTPAQSLNLSTRLQVGTGSSIGIAGFIITGNGPKQVLLRGLGPSLAQFGVPNVLGDPTMELRASDGSLVRANNNWRDTQEAEIIATGLAPTNDLESAILATLTSAAYTVVVGGENNTTGVGLIEVYDLGPETSQFGNISTRAFVGPSDQVMIGGFILGAGARAPTWWCGGLDLIWPSSA